MTFLNTFAWKVQFVNDATFTPSFADMCPLVFMPGTSVIIIGDLRLRSQSGVIREISWV